MRRLAFAAAVCGTLVLAACSDQTQSPTEPTVRSPAETFGTSCHVTPFPLGGATGIAKQITDIFTGTQRAQVLLRAEALLRAAAIKLLWDTCHPAAAKLVAFSFIDWLNRHTPVGKETQVQNLIVAILRAIGELAPASDGDFGVGFFDPKSSGNTLIKTVNGHAFILLEPGSFLVPTEIVISRKAGDPPLTNFGGQQFPPTYDYNAINSTNTHVLATDPITGVQHTAIVAFCLVYLESTEFPGGYAANLRIGHNPVAGAPGFPFEILDPVNLYQTELRSQLTCPDGTLGSAGGGLLDLANAAFQTAGSYLLPPPLWATSALIPLPPPPPLGGHSASLSPFRPVESSSLVFFQSESFGNVPFDPGAPPSPANFETEVEITWQYSIGGSAFADAYPAVQVLDESLNPMSEVSVTVSLVQVSGSVGTLVGTTTRSTSDGNSSAGPNTAVFNGLSIENGGVPGTYRLRFTASDLPGAPSIESGVFTVQSF